jgi:hypothetical protein
MSVRKMTPAQFLGLLIWTAGLVFSVGLFVLRDLGASWPHAITIASKVSTVCILLLTVVVITYENWKSR